MTKSETIIATAHRQIRAFAADQRAATAVEYALVASGVAVAIAGMVYGLGSNVKNLFTKVSSAY
jgi:pilus assembly protein Flp/PilA